MPGLGEERENWQMILSDVILRAAFQPVKDVF
jgi:hypothetical protein